MTVATDYQPVLTNGNGSSTVFDVPFRFDSPQDVRCVIYAADGTERVPAFIVTGSGSPGGTVTITDGAPAVGEQVLRFRETALRQPVNYEAGNFPSSAHERVADRLTMAAQDRAAIAGRTLRFDVRTNAVDPLPPIAAGRVLIRTAGGFGPGPDAASIEGAQAAAQEAVTLATAQVSLAEQQAQIATAQAIVATGQAENAISAVAAIPTALLPAGVVVEWPASLPVPVNWLEADGSTVQVDDHPELFVILGREFGGAAGTELLANGDFTSGLSGWVDTGPVTVTANDTITIGPNAVSILGRGIVPSVIPTKLMVEVDVQAITGGDILELITPAPTGPSLDTVPSTISMTTPGIHRAYVAVDEFPTGLNYAFYTKNTLNDIVINSASVTEGGTFTLPTLASGSVDTIKIINAGRPG